MALPDAVVESRLHVRFVASDERTSLDEATLAGIPRDALEHIASTYQQRHPTAGQATISVQQDSLGIPRGYTITYWRPDADTTQPTRADIVSAKYLTAQEVREWIQDQHNL